MRSASRLHGSGTCGPGAPPAARARRRLPGTTGLRFALHGRQRLWRNNGTFSAYHPDRQDRVVAC
ncbi:MAG: hypothetical protein KAX51_08020, partial [Chromatiaceae bacterium]|nr:hypothetical protein [Chromatiaceae bacterium]